MAVSQSCCSTSNAEPIGRDVYLKGSPRRHCVSRDALNAPIDSRKQQLEFGNAHRHRYRPCPDRLEARDKSGPTALVTTYLRSEDSPNNTHVSGRLWCLKETRKGRGVLLTFLSGVARRCL